MLNSKQGRSNHNFSHSSHSSGEDEDFLLAQQEDEEYLSPPPKQQNLSKQILNSEQGSLSESIQKQLVSDIEAGGGIDNIALESLLSRKKDIYQLQSKRAIQNKVNRWKKKQRTQYNQLVLSLSKSRLTDYSTPKRTSKSLHLTRSNQQQTHHSEMASPGTFLASLLKFPYEQISVRLDYPERSNGPFFIYYWTDYEHDKKTLHNAYHIELKDQDLRYMMGGKEAAFAAWHLGGNRIFVKIPSVSYGYLMDSTAEDAAKVAAGYTNSRSKSAHNVTRNAIVTNKDRHFKYFLLTFPEDPEDGLNNDIFSPGAENGKINIDLDVPIATFEVPSAKGPQMVNSFRANVWWDIAITETENRFVADVQLSKNEMDDKVTDRFSSMAF